MKHPHVEEIHAWADGKKIEKFLGCTTKGAPVWSDDKNPSWDLDSEYRVKAETKVVDMSVLIESGIDCEFSDDPLFNLIWVGKNIKIVDTEHHTYKSDSGDGQLDSAKYCRPRMNHIHAWQGGECPLPEGVMVKVLNRYNEWSPKERHAVDFDWRNSSQSWNTIAFEVVGLVDGYCWPWEVSDALTYEEKLKEAVQVLKQHNQWRRDECNIHSSINPTVLGCSIDLIVEYLEGKEVSDD